MSTTIRLDLVDNVTRRLGRIENKLGSLNNPVSSLASGFGGLKAAAGGFVAALAVREIAQFGQAIVDATDRFQNYENRLKLITNSQGELDATFRKLQQSSVSTRSSLDGTIDLYSKLTLSTKELGVNSSQVLNVTEKFQKALAISGADAGTAAGAIRQFGQAMASGTVRGDEFNSIVEALGPALSIMAEESGINVGELRKLSQEGKLTAETFFKMVEGSKAIDVAFGKTSATISQLQIALNDAFDEFLVELGKAIGLTDAYTASQAALTRGLQNATRTIRGMGIAMEDIFDAMSVNNYASALQMVNDKLFVARKNANAFGNAFGDKDAVRTLTELQIQLTVLQKQADQAAASVRPVIKTMTDLELALAGLKPYEGIVKSAVGTDSAYQLASPTQKLTKDIEQLEIALGNLRSVSAVAPAVDQLTYARQIDGVIEMIKTKEGQITKIQTDAAAARQKKLDDAARQATEKALRAGEKERERLADIQKLQEDKAEAIRLSLMSEVEAEEHAHAQKLRDLESFYMKEGVLTQQGNQTVERLEKKHQETMKKLSQGRVDDQLSLLKSGEMSKIDLTKLSNDEIAKFTKDGAMEVFKIAAGQNKKIFEAYKAYQIANGIISTTSAVLNVLGNPAIPFPLNVAAAGVIGAMGAAQVAMIASQQYTGRQFGGPVTKGKSYMVGEGGKPEMFVPSGSGTIIPNKGLNSGGTVNVNFEINAVDAAGVDQIILQRKALITSIVREATENQGNRSFV